MAELMNGGTTTRDGRGLRELSTAELVRQAADQVSRLVRDELTLARMELAEKGRHAGKGAGLLGGGGLLAAYGVGVLILALVFGLATAMPAWLAALIVGVLLLVVAGVLALTGRSQVRRATPPMPRVTVRSVRADVDAVANAVRERGRP